MGNLRAEAGRDPYDRDLTDLVGELSTRSDDFRVRWASHDVRQYRTGTQPFHHPLVGDLTLAYEALQVTADIGQALIVYTAEPGSPSQDALNRLAEWSKPDTASRLRPEPSALRHDAAKLREGSAPDQSPIGQGTNDIVGHGTDRLVGVDPG